jgi:hypothetical protein
MVPIHETNLESQSFKSHKSLSCFQKPEAESEDRFCMRSDQLRCRLRVLKNRDASAWTWMIKIARCNEFFIKPQQSCEKLPREAILTVPLDPLVLSTFWPLFVFFFFCTEGENDILTMFLSYFLHSPLSPQKSIFLSFWRKIWQVLTKSLNALIELECFNDCVTHAAIVLIQRLLWDLVKSIWRICNARGFKNCATRTVFDFMDPMRSSYLSCQTHF